MKYKLEKIEIKDGHYSGVRPGHATTSKTCRVRKFDEDAEIVHSPKLEDIEDGDMIVVFSNAFDFTKTSPIIKIVELENNSLTFETGTSIYKLEVLDEQ
tara:strand:- start:128 stop:424 length:297 start_codon:yes stop_codon:yes gene_type:complete